MRLIDTCRRVIADFEAVEGEGAALRETLAALAIYAAFATVAFAMACLQVGG